MNHFLAVTDSAVTFLPVLPWRSPTLPSCTYKPKHAHFFRCFLRLYRSVPKQQRLTGTVICCRGHEVDRTMRRLPVVSFPPDSLFSFTHLQSVLSPQSKPLSLSFIHTGRLLLTHPSLSVCLFPLPLPLPLSLSPLCLSVPCFQSLSERWQPVDEKHWLAAGAVDDPDSVQLSF